jgi:hypothetical protein
MHKSRLRDCYFGLTSFWSVLTGNKQIFQVIKSA